MGSFVRSTFGRHGVDDDERASVNTPPPIAVEPADLTSRPDAPCRAARSGSASQIWAPAPDRRIPRDRATVRACATPPAATNPVWRILATVLCLGVHGCTEATGGAVELSWALRSTLDEDIDDCAAERINRIRLWWDAGTSKRYTTFPCRDNHGVTAFDLPTGNVALSVTPECDDGFSADPASFVAPPPIVRQVTTGQAVTLDAVLLVVRVDDCPPERPDRPCVCPLPLPAAP
jgi:hypothetical protein